MKDLMTGDTEVVVPDHDSLVRVCVDRSDSLQVLIHLDLTNMWLMMLLILKHFRSVESSQR